jgi:hypothetical protein
MFKVQVIRSHSAQARVYDIGGGVSEVVYSGPLSQAAFTNLVAGVRLATKEIGALVVRVEHTVLLMRELVVDTGAYGPNSPPGAVVASDEHIEYWTAYGKAVAAAGVMRAVFLARQIDLAREWARRHAVVAL